MESFYSTHRQSLMNNKFEYGRLYINSFCHIDKYNRHKFQMYVLSVLIIICLIDKESVHWCTFKYTRVKRNCVNINKLLSLQNKILYIWANEAVLSRCAAYWTKFLKIRIIWSKLRSNCERFLHVNFGWCLIECNKHA